VLALAGCAKSTPSDLAALVIRTQWTHFGDVPPGAVACISVDGNDADAALLHDLEKTAVPVVPGSKCTYSMQGSYEHGSNRPALLVDVTSHLDRDEVVYDSRHHGKWGLHIVLKVREVNGSWTIVKVLEQWAA